jgi:glycosyltransferase involved in cell wall biosynthesis
MLAIFESHPVQYRAPVYRKLQHLVPGRFHVFYGTDLSMRGNHDVGFGRVVAWDEALLDGYPNTVLKQARHFSLNGFRSLHGKGLCHVFSKYRPQAVLQTQFLYEYDFAVLAHASIRRIPVWIRQETQDDAYERSWLKNLLRSAAYRALYSFVRGAFFIGELNRRHAVRHGIRPERTIRSPYCTQDRFAGVAASEFIRIRDCCREKLGIGSDRNVVAFFGKLIPKKNPTLLLQAMPLLREGLRLRTTVLLVGSGELDAELKAHSAALSDLGVQCVFAGFVNQSAIRDFYAASDVVVLPSRREGETWGLVVNEGLHAGCGIVISDAVGCGAEFGDWERVRVIPQNDAPALARSLEQLSAFPREVGWAREHMKSYSIESAAEGLAQEIRTLSGPAEGLPRTAP